VAAVSRSAWLPNPRALSLCSLFLAGSRLLPTFVEERINIL
jgi:hypothetical protein